MVCTAQNFRSPSPSWRPGEGGGSFPSFWISEMKKIGGRRWPSEMSADQFSSSIGSFWRYYGVFKGGGKKVQAQKINKHTSFEGLLCILWDIGGSNGFQGMGHPIQIWKMSLNCYQNIKSPNIRSHNMQKLCVCVFFRLRLFLPPHLNTL